MLTIGLTGGIGSGKTVVSDLFSELGVPVIDTDIIARQVVSDSAIMQTLTECFGNAVISEHGQLDRAALAKIVFADTEKKKQLDALLHPLIRAQITQQLNQLLAENTNYVIIVVPLLFESDFHTLMDCTVTVQADETRRIERVRARDQRSEDEIRSIINQQIDDQSRIEKADFVIDNNSDINHLHTQVRKLHETFLAMSH